MTHYYSPDRSTDTTATLALPKGHHNNIISIFQTEVSSVPVRFRLGGRISLRSNWNDAQTVNQPAAVYRCVPHGTQYTQGENNKTNELTRIEIT